MLFKVKVQELIDQKLLSFSEEQPNVKTNPLPSHNGLVVNAIDEEGHTEVANEVAKVKTPMMVIIKKLQEHGFLKDPHNNFCVCEIEPNQCDGLKSCVQSLMSQGVIQFTKSKVSEEVSTIEPITIVYKRKRIEELVKKLLQPIIICIPDHISQISHLKLIHQHLLELYYLI